MKPLIPVVAFLLLFLSCGKKEKKQFSSWQVSGATFSTNDVDGTVGKAMCVLSSNDPANRFELSFRLGGFPHAGTYYLRRVPGNNPDSVDMGIAWKGNYYMPALSNVQGLAASVVNDKFSYQLLQGWFVNYADASDTVLVSGTFNEP